MSPRPGKWFCSPPCRAAYSRHAKDRKLQGQLETAQRQVETAQRQLEATQRQLETTQVLLLEAIGELVARSVAQQRHPAGPPRHVTRQEP